MPQIGDLDSCRALPLAPRAALDAFVRGRRFGAGVAVAARGARIPAARPARTCCCVAGVAVLRQGAAWLCLGSGPNGQGGTGGHAHNDKNSVELSFGDFDVVVDRGTFVYARDPAERDARVPPRRTAPCRWTRWSRTASFPDGSSRSRTPPEARVVRMERREGFEQATGEHRGYAAAGIVAPAHRRAARGLRRVRGRAARPRRAPLRRALVRPAGMAVLRPATAEERARLFELHGRGLSFGYDVERCVEVGGHALFAFGATLPWSLRVENTDVSPGYAEKKPARCLALASRAGRRCDCSAPCSFCPGAERCLHWAQIKQLDLRPM